MSDPTLLTDHAQIQHWAQARHGAPACVEGATDACEPAMLRFDFSDPDELVEPISWDQWFRCFDDADLALMCANDSRFYKLAPRH
jgi:hypothetical protein